MDSNPNFAMTCEKKFAEISWPFLRLKKKRRRNLGVIAVIRQSFLVSTTTCRRG